MKPKLLVGLMATGVAAVVAHTTVYGQAVEVEPTVPIETPDDARTHGLDDLRTRVAADGGVPQPDLSAYLLPGSTPKRNLAALGKLLFWDSAVGSDGQACASCHYHAGVDNRARNQVSPGLMRIRNSRNGDIRGYSDADAVPDVNFELRQPDETLVFDDFPLVRQINALLEDSNGVVSAAGGNVNDQVSSTGVLRTHFYNVRDGESLDECADVADPIFTRGGDDFRQVPPRNTPTTINAVFNAFNFWDGRANHFFNGVNPFGVQDPNAFVLKHENGSVQSVKISIPNSSLASQSVGPPLSDFEESCAPHGEGANRVSRTWPEVGKKLLRPNAAGSLPVALRDQQVNRSDSLIGRYANRRGNGTTITYRELVEQTFRPEWWSLPDQRIQYDPSGVEVSERPAAQAPEIRMPTPNLRPATEEEQADEAVVDDGSADDAPALADSNAANAPPSFTLMEANFSLFFGLAIQAYEQALVADDSPFDQWMRNGSARGFGDAEKRGLQVFTGKGKCSNCHGGPEFTNASVRNFQNGNNLIEPMVMGDNNFALYDNGFYNIGVTPTVEDIGRGGKGPTGKPLASSRLRLYEEVLGENVPFNITGDNRVLAVTEDEGEPVCNDVDNNGFCSRSEPLLPAFHRAAVDGAFKTPGLRNIALQGPFFHNGSAATLRQVVDFYNNGGNFCQFNQDDLDPDITHLGLSEGEKQDLVAFMVSLTDERVAQQRAPFDHPSLVIPNDGQSGEITLPAIGSRGSRATLQPFLGLDQQLVGNMPIDLHCSPDNDAAGG